MRLTRKSIQVITVISLATTVLASFPGEAMVFDPKGKKILMRDLKVGQEILSMHNNGTIFNDKVLSIPKADEDAEKVYIRVIYLDPLDKKSPRGVLLSPKHLVIKGQLGVQSSHAKDVKVGDRIIIYLKGFVAVRIVDVKRAKGAFSPITESGRMLVDGVLVSCYEGLPNHIISHAAYKYYLSFVSKFPWVQDLFEKKWNKRSISDYLIKWFFDFYLTFIQGDKGNQDL